MLGSDCFGKLGRTRDQLKDSASHLMFFDGRESGDGNSNISQLLGPSIGGLRPGETFNSLTEGVASATILVHTSGDISRYVDLGGLFWGENEQQQRTTLVHETLHYAFNMGDIDFANKYAGYRVSNPTLTQASQAITVWLNGGCK
jgi:hypothetical protein